MQNIGLFKAISAKMDYLSQRQSILAQNIANADTPSYRPQDLVPVDFSTVLKRTSGGGHLDPKKTDEQHMSMDTKVGDTKVKREDEPYEVAPVGNAVILEEQMLKSGQNIMDYNMMINLYQKNIGLIKTALGVS